MMGRGDNRGSVILYLQRGDNRSFCIYRWGGVIIGHSVFTDGGGVIIGHSVFTDGGRGDNRSFCIYRCGKG